MIHFVPSIIKTIYPQYIWNLNRLEPKVYLTFDDGPVIGVTDWVLNQLAKRNMKANFFVVGDNVLKNPSLAEEVLQGAHRIGNHTFHHMNSSKVSQSDYIEDVEKCEAVLLEKLNITTNLFRPPYGSLGKSKFSHLKDKYKVIMWDVLSKDYDLNLNPKICLEKTIKYTKNGSIIVFHDQQKSKFKLEKILNPYLDFLEDSGFETALL